MYPRSGYFLVRTILISGAASWSWIDLDNPDILQTVLQRMKMANLDPFTLLSKRADQSNEKENSVLHILARDPINDVRLDLIMDCLQAGYDPSLKNKENKTFLDGSDIKTHLLEKIKNSSSDWAHGIINALIHNIGGEEQNTINLSKPWTQRSMSKSSISCS